MPRSLPQDTHHTDSIRILSHPPSSKQTQHGTRAPPRIAPAADADAGLLALPAESLTHVSAFLDPQSLLALGRTCKRMRGHVSEENTWRRAFAWQFLGVPPEADFDDEDGGRPFLLRREETSWKKEFMNRWNLRRRWERSRNPTITHIPHHSPVSTMHLMPSQSLLTASLKYGVVARSHALTGKVLRGFLDAAGLLNGLGAGNPNAEFSPHVTQVALAHEAGTARVLWGFRNGDVALTTAPRAMDGARASAARHVRCRGEEAHAGPVRDLRWGAPTPGLESIVVCASGAADGRVKLWDAKRAQCLWTGPAREALVPDSVLKVALDALSGVVVAAMQSGDIFCWTGFGPLTGGDVGTLQFAPREIRVAPVLPVVPEDPREDIARLDVCVSTQDVDILLAYQGSAYFHRITVSTDTGVADRVTFGDGTTGALTALEPAFATQPSERSFVLAGDALGNIHVYPWPAPGVPGQRGAPPAYRFPAHEDGGVSALARTPAVLVSGSRRGTLKVWDALTFAPLRAFASHAARPAVGAEWDGVGGILLERDVLVASVGARVVAWRAGPVGRKEPANKGKHARAAKGAGTAKWHQQLEMHRDIAESRRDLDEERTSARRAFGREREQRSTLDALGLDELGAVEYALMLSRDEEEQRRRAAYEPAAASVDQGVFFADDDLQPPITTPSAGFGSQAPARASLSDHAGLYQNGARVPRVLPSPSTRRIQVSPRYRPEPMEAGTSVSPLGGSLSSPSHMLLPPAPPPVGDEHFPPVSRTPSEAGTSVSRATSEAGGGTPGSVQRSVSGGSSPGSSRSAWATPLRSSAAASPSGGGWAGLVQRSGSGSGGSYVSGAASPAGGGVGLLSAGFARRGAGERNGEREEEELRFAIELSLAEARSRGEEV